MERFDVASWANGMLHSIAKNTPRTTARVPPQHCSACGCSPEFYCKGAHHEGPCEACAAESR